MINCIVDGKKSTKCDEKVHFCIWKQMADKKMKHMCGPADGTKIDTPAVCKKYKDGKMECHCNTENCNGQCTPGTWTTMLPSMSTKMMSTAKTMSTEKTMEQGIREDNMDMMVEKISKDAACSSATDTVTKMPKMSSKKTNGIETTNGNIESPTAGKTDDKKTTSDSPVTKAAVHVVIGVFILITPFFN